MSHDVRPARIASTPVSKVSLTPCTGSWAVEQRAQTRPARALETASLTGRALDLPGPPNGAVRVDT